MTDLSRDGTITTARLIEMLAPTLGWEKSSEVVDATALRLQLSPSGVTLEEALTLLDDLARTPGMVGISARFARSRLDAPYRADPTSAIVPTLSPPSTRAPRSSPEASSAARPATTVTTVTTDDIAALLASAMGAEKAQETVRAAARRLGFTPDRLDRSQAMALLDQLAVEPGVVGLCARFGKARLILRFAA